jgi:hypothetical protein
VVAHRPPESLWKQRLPISGSVCGSSFVVFALLRKGCGKMTSARALASAVVDVTLTLLHV